MLFTTVYTTVHSLELYKYIREVARYTNGLEDSHSEVELSPFNKMFLGRREGGHKLQGRKGGGKYTHHHLPPFITNLLVITL